MIYNVESNAILTIYDIIRFTSFDIILYYMFVRILYSAKTRIWFTHIWLTFDRVKHGEDQQMPHPCVLRIFLVVIIPKIVICSTLLTP